MSKPRVLFFGTPAIALPTLRALRELTTVVAVVCQPDKPAGRDQAPRPPPTKLLAAELGLPVHQPAKVRTPEFLAWVRDQHADAAVVLAYGRILTKDVLAAPRLGCINLHASILPRYRGAAPITWAIVRGEQETGISVMQMDEGIDTGPVFAARRIAIGPDETAGELTERLAALGAEITRAELLAVLDGRSQAAAQQEEALATLAPILTKGDGTIDWTRSAAQVHDHARGMHPWPGAFTYARGKLLKVLETRRVAHTLPSAPPGSVLDAGKGQIWVACGEGTVAVTRAQLEGRKALSAAELLSGRAVTPGEVLGAERP